MADAKPNCSEPGTLETTKNRLGELNTKAYYLLVALSFLCFHGSAPGIEIPLPLKWALTLTSVAAVLPLQDIFAKQTWWLHLVKWFKVLLLFVALVFTIWWVWWWAL